MTARRHKTRNQRKREQVKFYFMTAALVVMWMILLTTMVKTWAEHPAEQTVTYAAYMESIQDGCDSNG